MRKWLKKHLVNLILFAIILVGMGLMAYPTFADWWNSFHQARAIQSYAKAVSNLDREEYDRIIAEAEEYNRRISETGVHWNMKEEEIREYNRMLSIDDSGIMGYIDIPKINVRLPLYHGIEDRVLEVAIGHIAGTSLPVGGEGSHCVLSGHRGLPSARLFTDLDKIVEGDTWTLTVLDRTYTYECDQIRVVEPTDLSALAIEEGKDYCTLVTCTPYGINTHRLLVRGHRVDNPQGDVAVVADAMIIDSVYVAPFIAAPIILILVLIVLLGNRKPKKGAKG